MRQNIRTALYFVMMTMAVLGFSVSTGHAETKIAVVDVQKLLKDSVAAQDIQTQLVKQRDIFQKELTAHEKKLMALEKEILAKKDTMSAEQLQKERVGFEKQLIEARNQVKARSEILEKAVIKGRLRLRTEIVKTIAEMSEKENYTMVITKQNVILAEKELDITEDVMKKLNKKIKKIKLEMQ